MNVPQDASMPPISAPPDAPQEFLDDAQERLGRANGNVYKRTAGVEGVHDGQIMVRLKKKRWLVLDYSPEAGGRQVCSASTCSKMAVPTLLYDSDPTEPPSLYLRSGLCFTCQRRVNEKRRSQRRHTEGAASSPSRRDTSVPALPQKDHTFLLSEGHAHKKFKLPPPEFLDDLSSSAIIIDGPLEGTKSADANYGYAEIGGDIQQSLQEAAQETADLLTLAANSDKTNSQCVIAMAAAIAAGTKVISPSAEASADIEALYQKAMMSAKKSVYLLSQWKMSWDATVATSTDLASADGMDGHEDHADDKADILPEAKAELETFAV